MLLRGLESASKGMQSLIEMNDNTANNLANVNTVGYKRQNLTFKNIYEAAVIEKTGNAISGDTRNIGTLSVGNEVQKLTHDFSRGAFQETGSPFDLAIAGDGFFKVQDTDGNICYTKNGSFTINNNSNLVTKDGDYVLDVENKRIKISTDGLSMHSVHDIVVNERGQIEINNEKNKVTLQTLKIVDFSDKEELQSAGAGKFLNKNPQTNPEKKADKFVIQQGFLELSNANTVMEMINTINTTRNYEALSKIVKSSDDTLAKAMSVGRMRG
jgi:flagellar basal body rod protein FlgG